MRIKSSSGITIKTPKIKKLTSKRFIPYIDFNKQRANIIILSYQPGFGKTYNALKYMRQPQNINTFYFTNRHETIKERIEDWESKNKPLPTHWMGFDKEGRCSDKNKKSLYKNFKISPGKLCEGCSNKSKCKYISQFNTCQRVFSPVEYISKNQFKDKIKDIKTIFVDERVSKVEVRAIDKKEVIKAFKEINTPKTYITDINKGNYTAFTSRKLQTIMDRYWTTIDKALQNNDKKKLEKLKDFNPSYLKEYFKWGNIYNFNKTRYGIPFYYYVFDALNLNSDLKVVILDASYNDKLFRYFLYSYNGEKGFTSNIVVQEYTTNESNKNTIVFRMRPNAWHPKASFTKKYDEPSVEDWIQIHLKNIREIFGEENVGIITFKELGEKSKFLGFNVEYYGNLRSKNTFEKMPVLVVLGHFFPPMIQSKTDAKGVKQKGLEETIEEWFLRDTTTYSIIELKEMIFRKYGKKTKRATKWKQKYFGASWPRRYADEWGKTTFQSNDTVKLYPAKTIQDYFDDEIYQAVHRNRGLQNNRIIFLYCWIPPYKKYLCYGGEHLYRICEEFDFRKIKNDEEEDFFTSLKNQIGNRELVSSILNDIDYEKKSPTTIARERKISRRNIYNRPDGSGGHAAQYVRVLRDGVYKRDVGKNRLKDDRFKIDSLLKKKLQ